jgi:hypothetical protein
MNLNRSTLGVIQFREHFSKVSEFPFKHFFQFEHGSQLLLKLHEKFLLKICHLDFILKTLHKIKGPQIVFSYCIDQVFDHDQFHIITIILISENLKNLHTFFFT